MLQSPVDTFMTVYRKITTVSEKFLSPSDALMILTLCGANVAKSNNRGWDGKHLNLSVEDENTEELRELVPEERTNEKLLDLAQEHTKQQEKRKLQKKKKPRENWQEELRSFCRPQ